jgi:fibronectin type 3 domain-containing protein
MTFWGDGGIPMRPAAGKSRQPGPGIAMRAFMGACALLLMPSLANATVPASPANLSATAVSEVQINLSWTDQSNNETNFKIERKTGSGSFTQIAMVGINVTNFSDTAVAGGTTYFYRVRAANSSGNSAYTNQASATTPSATPPTPVAAYSFDEGAGTTLGDASGNGYNGTLTNAPSWTTGRFGSALQFDASDDNNDDNDPRVVLGRTINIPDFPLTISAWINPIDYDDWRGIISKRDSPVASDMRLDIGLMEVSGRVYVFTGGQPYVFTGGSHAFLYAPPVNTWTHLALVADSSGTRLYVNGVLQETFEVIALGTDASANTVIGGTGEGSGGNNDPFKGKIDDLRIYNRALSAAEIQADMNTAVVPVAPDTIPPSVPSAISAAVVSASQIDLSWTASTDNVGVTAYSVERGQGAGCTSFTQIATPSGTSLSDSGLAASTSYCYRVRATDAAGNLSAYSSIVTATTQAVADVTPPTVPSGLNATALSSSQISLNWTASTDDVGISGYQVDRCQGVGCTTFVQVATPVGTSFGDAGLSPTTSYSYRVRAVDAAGNVSANSNVASATTQAPPDTTAPTAPSNLTANAGSNNQINLTWLASTDNVGVSGYRVERCQGVGCSAFTQIAAPTGTSFSDTGLTAATYGYRVRASDAAGNLSAYSNVASATLSVISLTVTSPTPGAVIASDTVTVLGSFSGPENTGINVSSVGNTVATIVGSEFVATNVQLQPGANTLTVNLTTSGNQIVTTTLSVTSTGSAPINVLARPAQGVAPLSVDFSIDNRTGNAIQSVLVDYAGTGSFASVNPAALSNTYTTPGIYQAAFIVTDGTGAITQQTVPIVVQDPAQIDQTLRAEWAAFTTTLAAQDTAQALQYFDLEAQEKYGPVFSALLPSLPQIVASFSAPQLMSVSGEVGEYVVSRNINGVSQNFFIYFLRDNVNGVWRLNSM